MNGIWPSDKRPPMGAKTCSLELPGARTSSTGAKLSPEFF
jgi:hypothetical protein